jgi:hypothetical protein
VTAADLSPDDQVLLNRAASLLDLVGRFADDYVCGLMAIRSLRAADLLVRAGAKVAQLRMQLSPGDARAAVRQALRLLGLLSPDAFGRTEVTEAAETAQQAFAAS